MDKVTRRCPQTTTFFKRKESRSGIEPRSFRLPAKPLTSLTARPNRLTYRFRRRLNPFTAMLAAPSLSKRPIKMPNLKSLRPFFPFAWTREKKSIKLRRTESSFVIGPSNILLAGVRECTFQPGNCTGCGSEGVERCSLQHNGWLTGVSKRVNWFLDFDVRESIGQGRQGLQVQPVRLRGTNHALTVSLHYFQTQVSTSQVKAGPQFWKQQPRKNTSKVVYGV